MSDDKRLGMIFVAGPPGAGKTTMASEYQRTSQHIEQFGTGDLIRDVSSGCLPSRYGNITQYFHNNGLLLPEKIFANIVSERVLDIKDDIDTLLVTGFPYGYSDWDIFKDKIAQTRVRLLGAVALRASLRTCVTRMQKRDIERNKDEGIVYSTKEQTAYEERFHEHLARSAIRLSCYAHSDLDITHINADKSHDEVFGDFYAAVNTLRMKGAV